MNVNIHNKVSRSCKAQIKFIILQHVSVYMTILGEILKILMGGTQVYMYTEIQIKHALM
jgi:hypothetical protein